MSYGQPKSGAGGVRGPGCKRNVFGDCRRAASGLLWIGDRRQLATSMRRKIGEGGVGIGGPRQSNPHSARRASAYILVRVDLDKTQQELVRSPEGLPADVIVSPDTRRGERVPPGQSRTRKWPVLDAAGPPPIDLGRWRFRMWGLLRRPVAWTWEQFLELPRVKVFADFHCVTRWSRLGNIWEGVSTRALVELAGGALPEVRYALAHGHDGGWTTNMSIDDFLAEDALVAFRHDGEPVAWEHGGPARLVVPQLYAWKSAKWVAGVEFLERDKAGFWEQNGYHMNGDPWKEERYGWV